MEYNHKIIKDSQGNDAILINGQLVSLNKLVETFNNTASTSIEDTDNAKDSNPEPEAISNSEVNISETDDIKSEPEVSEAIVESEDTNIEDSNLSTSTPDQISEVITESENISTEDNTKQSLSDLPPNYSLIDNDIIVDGIGNHLKVVDNKVVMIKLSDRYLLEAEDENEVNAILNWSADLPPNYATNASRDSITDSECNHLQVINGKLVMTQLSRKYRTDDINNNSESNNITVRDLFSDDHGNYYKISNNEKFVEVSMDELMAIVESEDTNIEDSNLSTSTPDQISEVITESENISIEDTDNAKDSNPEPEAISNSEVNISETDDIKSEPEVSEAIVESEDTNIEDSNLSTSTPDQISEVITESENISTEDTDNAKDSNPEPEANGPKIYNHVITPWPKDINNLIQLIIDEPDDIYHKVKAFPEGYWDYDWVNTFSPSPEFQYFYNKRLYEEIYSVGDFVSLFYFNNPTHRLCHNEQSPYYYDRMIPVMTLNGIGIFYRPEYQYVSEFIKPYVPKFNVGVYSTGENEYIDIYKRHDFCYITVLPSKFYTFMDDKRHVLNKSIFITGNLDEPDMIDDDIEIKEYRVRRVTPTGGVTYETIRGFEAKVVYNWDRLYLSYMYHALIRCHEYDLDMHIPLSRNIENYEALNAWDQAFTNRKPYYSSIERYNAALKSIVIPLVQKHLDSKRRGHGIPLFYSNDPMYHQWAPQYPTYDPNFIGNWNYNPLNNKIDKRPELVRDFFGRIAKYGWYNWQIPDPEFPPIKPVPLEEFSGYYTQNYYNNIYNNYNYNAIRNIVPMMNNMNQGQGTQFNSALAVLPPLPVINAGTLSNVPGKNPRQEPDGTISVEAPDDYIGADGRVYTWVLDSTTGTYNSKPKARPLDERDQRDSNYALSKAYLINTRYMNLDDNNPADGTIRLQPTEYGDIIDSGAIAAIDSLDELDRFTGPECFMLTNDPKWHIFGFVLNKETGLYHFTEDPRSPSRLVGETNVPFPPGTPSSGLSEKGYKFKGDPLNLYRPSPVYRTVDVFEKFDRNDYNLQITNDPYVVNGYIDGEPQIVYLSDPVRNLPINNAEKIYAQHKFQDHTKMFGEDRALRALAFYHGIKDPSILLKPILNPVGSDANGQAQVTMNGFNTMLPSQQPLPTNTLYSRVMTIDGVTAAALPTDVRTSLYMQHDAENARVAQLAADKLRYKHACAVSGREYDEVKASIMFDPYPATRPGVIEVFDVWQIADEVRRNDFMTSLWFCYNPDVRYCSLELAKSIALRTYLKRYHDELDNHDSKQILGEDIPMIMREMWIEEAHLTPYNDKSKEAKYSKEEFYDKLVASSSDEMKYQLQEQANRMAIRIDLLAKINSDAFKMHESVKKYVIRDINRVTDSELMYLYKFASYRNIYEYIQRINTLVAIKCFIAKYGLTINEDDELIPVDPKIREFIKRHLEAGEHDQLNSAFKQSKEIFDSFLNNPRAAAMRKLMNNPQQLAEQDKFVKTAITNRAKRLGINLGVTPEEIASMPITSLFKLSIDKQRQKNLLLESIKDNQTVQQASDIAITNSKDKKSLEENKNLPEKNNVDTNSLNATTNDNLIKEHQSSNVNTDDVKSTETLESTDNFNKNELIDNSAEDSQELNSDLVQSNAPTNINPNQDSPKITSILSNLSQDEIMILYLDQLSDIHEALTYLQSTAYKFDNDGIRWYIIHRGFNPDDYQQYFNNTIDNNINQNISSESNISGNNIITNLVSLLDSITSLNNSSEVISESNDSLDNHEEVFDSSEVIDVEANEVLDNSSDNNEDISESSIQDQDTTLKSDVSDYEIEYLARQMLKIIDNHLDNNTSDNIGIEDKIINDLINLSDDNDKSIQDHNNTDNNDQNSNQNSDSDDHNSAIISLVEEDTDKNEIITLEESSEGIDKSTTDQIQSNIDTDKTEVIDDNTSEAKPRVSIYDLSLEDLKDWTDEDKSDEECRLHWAKERMVTKIDKTIRGYIDTLSIEDAVKYLYDYEYDDITIILYLILQGVEDLWNYRKYFENLAQAIRKQYPNTSMTSILDDEGKQKDVISLTDLTLDIIFDPNSFDPHHIDDITLNYLKEMWVEQGMKYMIRHKYDMNILFDYINIKDAVQYILMEPYASQIKELDCSNNDNRDEHLTYEFWRNHVLLMPDTQDYLDSLSTDEAFDYLVEHDYIADTVFTYLCNRKPIAANIIMYAERLAKLNMGHYDHLNPLYIFEDRHCSYWIDKLYIKEDTKKYLDTLSVDDAMKYLHDHGYITNVLYGYCSNRLPDGYLGYEDSCFGFEEEHPEYFMDLYTYNCTNGEFCILSQNDSNPDKPEFDQETDTNSLTTSSIDNTQLNDDNQKIEIIDDNSISSSEEDSVTLRDILTEDMVLALSGQEDSSSDENHVESAQLDNLLTDDSQTHDDNHKTEIIEDNLPINSLEDFGGQQDNSNEAITPDNIRQEDSMDVHHEESIQSTDLLLDSDSQLHDDNHKTENGEDTNISPILKEESPMQYTKEQDSIDAVNSDKSSELTTCNDFQIHDDNKEDSTNDEVLEVVDELKNSEAIEDTNTSFDSTHLDSSLTERLDLMSIKDAAKYISEHKYAANILFDYLKHRGVDYDTNIYRDIDNIANYVSYFQGLDDSNYDNRDEHLTFKYWYEHLYVDKCGYEYLTTYAYNIDGIIKYISEHNYTANILFDFYRHHKVNILNPRLLEGFKDLDLYKVDSRPDKLSYKYWEGRLYIDVETLKYLDSLNDIDAAIRYLHEHNYIIEAIFMYLNHADPFIDLELYLNLYSKYFDELDSLFKVFNPDTNETLIELYSKYSVGNHILELKELKELSAKIDETIHQNFTKEALKYFEQFSMDQALKQLEQYKYSEIMRLYYVAYHKMNVYDYMRFYRGLHKGYIDIMAMCVKYYNTPNELINNVLHYTLVKYKEKCIQKLPNWNASAEEIKAMLKKSKDIIKRHLSNDLLQVIKHLPNPNNILWDVICLRVEALSKEEIKSNPDIINSNVITLLKLLKEHKLIDPNTNIPQIKKNS